MAFREDRAALVERVDALERELTAGKDDAAKVDELTQSLRLAIAERDRLREGAAPIEAQARRRTMLLVALVVLAAGAAITLSVQDSHYRTDRAQGRVAQLERQLSRSEDATRGALQSIHAAPTGEIHTRAWVTSAQGLPLAIDTHCTLDVVPLPEGRCRASVSCGTTRLFPRTGEGAVSCVLHDGRIATAASSSGPSSSGPSPGASPDDAVLALDVDEGTLTVSEAEPSWWSVGLHVPPF